MLRSLSPGVEFHLGFQYIGVLKDSSTVKNGPVLIVAWVVVSSISWGKIPVFAASLRKKAPNLYKKFI